MRYSTICGIPGLVVAVVTGGWYLKQIYTYAYFPLYLTILLLGALAGILPRVRLPSTKGEGTGEALFLWVGMGSDAGAGCAAGSLEGAAAQPCR